MRNAMPRRVRAPVSAKAQGRPASRTSGRAAGLPLEPPDQRREPLHAPDQVRGRLSPENALRCGSFWRASMSSVIRPVARADYDQWLPLWDGYNAFYKRTGPTAVPPEVTQMTWARFFDGYE